MVTGALEGPTSGVVASIVLAGIVRPALAVLILFSPDSTSDLRAGDRRLKTERLIPE